MIKSMSVDQLKHRIDTAKDTILIDCREQEEWDEGHIPAARLIPLSQFEERFSEITEDKDAEILIHCRSGKRSMDACIFLMNEGYSNLNNIEGGILAWAQKGYKIIAD